MFHDNFHTENLIGVKLYVSFQVILDNFFIYLKIAETKHYLGIIDVKNIRQRQDKLITIHWCANNRIGDVQTIH